MNPIENAMPIKAIPLPRFCGSKISAITAVHSPILPLNIPPIVLEIKNIKNDLDDKHHNK